MKRTKQQTPAFIVAAITIDLLLIVYTIIMVIIKYLTDKRWVDIFYDKSIEMIRPQYLFGLISNGLVVFIFLFAYIYILIDEE